MDDSFCLFTQVSKHRRTDDQYKVFEQGEVEHDHDQAQHHTGHNEKETEPFTPFALQPGLDAHLFTHPGDRIIGGRPEKIHTGNEQRSIDDTGNDDPFPELVLLDKTMGF